MGKKFELIPGNDEDYEEISKKHFDCGVTSPILNPFFDEDFPESLKIKMMELTDVKTKLQKIAPEFTDDGLSSLKEYLSNEGHVNLETKIDTSKIEGYDEFIELLKKDPKFDYYCSELVLSRLSR